MIENDDQGVESQFIDPFSPSMEAYPFPVEDYIPPPVEKTIPDPDQVIVPSVEPVDIPQLNVDGTLENGNALKVTKDEGVVPWSFMVKLSRSSALVKTLSKWVYIAYE